MLRRVFRRVVGLGLALGGLMLSGCSFGTLGRVSIDGRDAAGALSQVSVERDGKTLATTAGMAIEKGDFITTGPDVAAVVRFAGARATLSPNTRIEILNPSIWTWFGEVFLSGFFTNNTEYVAATVDGTEYAVQVDPDTKATSVTVLSGRVRVRSRKGAWPEVVVRARERLDVADATTPPQKRPLSRAELNAIVATQNRTRDRFSKPLLPDVVSLPRRQAEAQLRAAGVERIRFEERPIRGRAADRVLAQAPKGGERGDAVVLTVAVAGVVVPTLIGLPLETAEVRLAEAGLSLGAVGHEPSGPDAIGTVLSQDLRAGELAPPKARVSLVVGAAPEREPEPPPDKEPDAGANTPPESEPRPDPNAAPVAVPDVRRQSPDHARDVLARHGLRTALSHELSDDVQQSVVVDQLPAPGRQLGRGGVVQLSVHDPGVRVPDVRGQPAQSALAQLERAALQGLLDRDRDGIAEGQEPKAGTLVAPGTRVRITLQRNCTVPDVDSLVDDGSLSAEQLVEALQARFAEAGLKAQIDLPAGTPPPFEVTGRSHQSGSEIPCGSRVSLTIRAYGPF